MYGYSPRDNHTKTSENALNDDFTMFFHIEKLFMIRKAGIEEPIIGNGI